MGIDHSNLKEETGGLVGFTGHEAFIAGMINLPLTIRTWPRVTTEIIQFLVVDIP